MKPIRSGQNVKPRRVVVLTFTREQDGCFLFFIEWKAVPPSCLGKYIMQFSSRNEMCRNGQKYFYKHPPCIYRADFKGREALTFSTPSPMIACVLAADSSAGSLMPAIPVCSSSCSVLSTGRTTKVAPFSPA